MESAKREQWKVPKGNNGKCQKGTMESTKRELSSIPKITDKDYRQRLLTEYLEYFNKKNTNPLFSKNNNTETVYKNLSYQRIKKRLETFSSYEKKA